MAACQKWSMMCLRLIARSRYITQVRTVMLSPSQVSTKLRKNEATVDGRVRAKFPVRACDSNQLPSNSPNEDRRNVARILSNNASIFGVFDGHAGPACAQTVSDRLFDYVAISILNDEELDAYNQGLRDGKAEPLLRQYHFENDYANHNLSHIYRQSLQKFVVELLSAREEDHELPLTKKIARAIRRLDSDILYEALDVMGNINFDALDAALSGTVGTVVYVHDLDVIIANFGDCRAVLGQQTAEGEWVAKPLTQDHCSDNKSEVDRLKKSHPMNEQVLVQNRLLGMLSPLRAMGDARFKWDVNDVKKIESALDKSIMPPRYFTPPYLTSKPEMFHYSLTPRDRFIVLATDGLWNFLSNEKVVQLVGDHMESVSTPERVYFDVTMNLGAMNRVLTKRKPNLNRPMNNNAATHLIKNALATEHRVMSKVLSYPQDIVRDVRDDITVTIIYLDEKFLDNKYVEEC